MTSLHETLFLAKSGQSVAVGDTPLYQTLFARYISGNTSPGTEKTVSGSFVSLTDAIAHRAFVSLIAQISSADGLTGAAITRTGSNLLKTTDGRYDITARSIRVHKGTATCDVTGRSDSAVLVPAGAFDSSYILPAGTYYFDPGIEESEITFGDPFVRFKDADGTTYDLGSDGTITLPVAAYIVDIRDSITHSWYAGDTYTLSPTITYALGEDFEPFTSNNYSVSWLGEAGKVYGGSYDFVSGELTVTYEAVDLGQLLWSRRSSTDKYIANAPDDCYKGEDIAGQTTSDISCDGYTSVSAYDGYNGVTDMGISVSYWNSTNRIQITNSEVANAAELKTSLNGVYLIYRLASNKKYQLPSVTIKTIADVNNIWSDVGDASVTYLASN